MAGEKNFKVKNGLTVNGIEVVDSSGKFTAAGLGAAVNEGIDDRVNDLLVAGTGISLTYDDDAGTLQIDGQVGDVTGVTAGNGLSGGGTSGDVSVALDTTSATFTEGVDDQVNTLFTAGTAISKSYDDTAGTLTVGVDTTDSTLLEAIDDRLSSTLTAGTGITLSYDDDGDSLTINSEVGDITAVSASAGLTGGGTSGDVALSVGAGTGITVNADDVAVDMTAFDTDDLSEGSTNQYFTNARARGAVSVTGDGLSYNSSTGVITHAQVDTDSVSEGDSNLYFTDARADARIAAATSDDVGEGSTNLYFTNERVDDRVDALITAGTNITTSYDDAAGTLTINSSGKTEEEIEDIVGAQLVTNGSHTNITASYDDAGDGAIDLSITDAAIRGKISVTDSGGDGSLAYDNGTGVITYTGPSAAEVQAHITAGTGVSISSGEVSIGQAVATNSNVTFNNATIDGNLTVNGTTVTNSATNTTIEDALIELGSGNTGANSNDLGLVLERGSTGDNAFIGWDESADRFIVGTTTATGSSTGGLSITETEFRAGAMSTAYANNSGGYARNVYQSTSAPASGDGQVGDLWVLYS